MRAGKTLADDFSGFEIGQRKAHAVGIALTGTFALKVDGGKRADEHQRLRREVGRVQGFDLVVGEITANQADHLLFNGCRTQRLHAGGAVHQRIDNHIEFLPGGQLRFLKQLTGRCVDGVPVWQRNRHCGRWRRPG